MVLEHASVAEVREKLLSREEYHPFPKYEERKAWEAIPGEVKEYYLGRAEEILNFQIPVLRATSYIRYHKPNKSPAYNTASRREYLLMAVIAECIEHQGRFIDQIIDLVWAICEESAWISPAHNNHMHNYMWSGVVKNLLPDVTDFNFIDLDTGNTCGTVCLTYYFLKDELDKVSPLVCKRIELEIMKRIVIPFMNHDDLTWFGFYGHKINNWNPWILSNIIPAGLITIKDPDLRVEFIARCMEKLEIYIEQCPADGGCDEGPGYWGVAGGALFDCLEEIYGMTGGKLNFFNEPLIRKIGEYITKAHAYDNEFFNFADNNHQQAPDTPRLFRFGMLAHSEKLTAFALAFDKLDREKYHQTFGQSQCRTADNYRHAFCQLQDIFTLGKMLSAPEIPFVPSDAYLPDTQIFYIRDSKNQLAAAAKGGFNNESHNHNDLGHFICSYEGEQIFADLGSLPYTAKTFSPYRYTIWILQSAYHNCASFNGFDQHDGDNYRAEFVSEAWNDQQGSYAVELKGAYEKDAGVESYVRKFVMDKVNSVWTVFDHVELKEESKEVDFHYITLCEPKLCGNYFEITMKNGHTAKVEFDAECYDFSVDTHDLESDAKKKSWGVEEIYRIHLNPKKSAKVFDSYIKVTVK